MYESVEPWGHPQFEALVARAVAERLPADFDHDATLERIEPLETFADKYRSRAALERHVAVRLRAEYTAAAARGRTIPLGRPFPRAEIAALLLAPHGSNPNGVEILAERFSAAVTGDEGELARIHAALETAPPFDSALRPLIARKVTLEARLPDRKRAWDAFTAAFSRAVAAAIGDHAENLIASVAEARAMSGEITADASAVALGQEIDAINRQLESLAVVGVRGPRASALQQQRQALEDRMEALRREHAATVEAAIRADVSRAVAGDIGAWAELWRSMLRHQEFFPPGLFERIGSAGMEAIRAADAAVQFAACLEAANTKQPREF